jgi:hypothetical protein
MRKVSVLSLSVAAALGLMASTVQSATLIGGDLPDVRLAPGQSGDNIFDLNDFFSSSAGTITYTAGAGGSVNGSMASVFGGQTPGKSTATFTASAGGETLTSEVNVFVNSFTIGNAPDIANNNRLAGVAAGNLFLNALTPGETLNSAMNITGLPAGGSSPGGGTGAGGTGAAALIVTIATVDITRTNGVIVHDHPVVASGAGTASIPNQLTVTLNQNGSYTLTAGNAISGDYLVSLGASSGGTVDGFSIVAAQAVAVNLTAAGTLAQVPTLGTGASATFGAGGATVTVPGGAALLLVDQTPIPVSGGVATISVDVTTPSTNANIAVVGFDGALVGDRIAYTNPGATNLQANARKNISTTIRPTSGSVLPGVQVFNAGTAALTVTIHSMEVVMANPIPDYANNPNARADLPVPGSIAGITGWGFNIAATANAIGPVLSTENNFASTSSQGSLALNGGTAASGVANAFVQVAVGQGEAVAECYVKRTGAASDGDFFAIVYTDGGANSFASFNPASAIPQDSWMLAQASGTLSAAANGFLVVQAAGFDAVVDDVQVRVADDNDAWFDAELLGM